ncbi:MAG: beta-ketoacyl synthase N-terminal-like domain-containing protein, partial [Planctomycetota bacterium]
MPDSPPNPNALASTPGAPLWQGAASLDEVVRVRAAHHGDRLAYRFLADGESVSNECTYAELDTRARLIAGWLQGQGLTDRPVLLVFPERIDYAAAFLGCLYAGAIATPVNPPRRNRKRSRLEGVVRDSGATVALTSAATLDRYRVAAHGAAADLRWQAVDAIPPSAGDAWRPTRHDADATAFLQYTSGSTGTPKGVVVSHGNLLENQRLIARAFGQDESIVVAGWLPIYHDMGLIGNVLHPLYLGGRLVFMPPVAFLQKPIRWLRMISDHGATIAGGPDFAFDLCVTETTADERDQLDLSRWQVAFNGSEPIHAATLERFTEAFTPHGFGANAFSPCFGMAETTLLVSGSRKTSPPLSIAVDTDKLAAGVFTPTDAAGQTLVSSGPPDESLRIEIVDPDTEAALAEGQVGEVWVAGDTVAHGYWNQPALSEQTFRAKLRGADGAPFLRTGDLGVLHGGELFITGRLKDLLIIRGVNHYPQDIERTAEAAHPALATGGAAAFAIELGGETGSEERVALAVEVQRTALRQLPAPQVFDAIRRAVADEHDLGLATIVLVRTGSLPKTSSGKRQRRLTRELYLSGELNTVASTADDDAAPPQAAPSEPRVINRQQQAAVEELVAWLIDKIAQRRGIAPDTIDPAQPFASYGLDSLAAVRLSGELSDKLGRDVPPTLAYDYPTPRQAAAYLVLGGQLIQAAAKPGTDPDEPLAIVGVGCRFPGGATPVDYWNALRDGVCSITPAPTDRWPSSSELPPAGFLPAVDRFDPQHFGISPREADQMDPQQRLLLEVAWETFENAGQPIDALRRQPVGVFVGVSASDYPRLQAEAGAAPDPYDAIGGSLAVIANRLSYTLDLRGPSQAIDTACSSSLVAVHNAAAAIRRGDCDTALAGGVSLMLSSAVTESLVRAGMLSVFGLSRSFCRGGDGFVRGEGCGLVLLKRLGCALADGDRVLA